MKRNGGCAWTGQSFMSICLLLASATTKNMRHYSAMCVIQILKTPKYDFLLMLHYLLQLFDLAHTIVLLLAWGRHRGVDGQTRLLSSHKHGTMLTYIAEYWRIFLGVADAKSRPIDAKWLTCPGPASVSFQNVQPLRAIRTIYNWSNMFEVHPFLWSHSSQTELTWLSK